MEVYMGMISAFAFNYAPLYWLQCTGQMLTINQYSALFALLGVQYGGNAQTNFQLPNLGGRSMRGMGQSAGTSPVTMGQYAGVESVTTVGTAAVNFTLAPSQIPGHSHPASFSTTSGPQNINIPAVPGSGSITVNPAPTVDVLAGATGVNPVAGQSYWLTGVKSPSAGPVSGTGPTGTTKASLNGVNVTIDASNYQPAIPASTVAINAVNGGSVTVASQNNQTAPVNVAAACQSAFAVLNPFVGVNFCIAVQGLFPPRND